MSEVPPEHPDGRLQVSLRKLLLWTGVFAFWFGIWKPLGLGFVFLGLTGWGILVGAVRVLGNLKIAAFVSVTIAECVFAFLLLVCESPYRRPPGAEFVSGAIAAAFFGLFVFVVVEGFFAIVDRLNGLGIRQDWIESQETPPPMQSEDAASRRSPDRPSTAP